jgi:hypothetical protein
MSAVLNISLGSCEVGTSQELLYPKGKWQNFLAMPMMRPNFALLFILYFSTV